MYSIIMTYYRLLFSYSIEDKYNIFYNMYAIYYKNVVWIKKIDME